MRRGRLLPALVVAVVAVPVVGGAVALHLSPPAAPPGPPVATTRPAPVTGGAGAGSPPSGAAPGEDGTRSPVERVDASWAGRVAAATGVPVRAVLAYASADLTVDAEQPACGIGWNTLAAIGAVESGHGSHGGAVLGADGRPDRSIRGVPLDGDGVAAIPDTDGGRWDDDTVWDRAVGPMQFIPSTWARWGADGDGDGTADPDQLDDAALAAGRYLCAGTPTTPGEWRRAVLSYNRSEDYVDVVARLATELARAASGA